MARTEARHPRELRKAELAVNPLALAYQDDRGANSVLKRELWAKRSTFIRPVKLPGRQAQGPAPETAVKEAALGVDAGAREVYPDAERRDHCLHCSVGGEEECVWQ